ncbi:MAG: VOC family protein [Chloroflexota bacterium]
MVTEAPARPATTTHTVVHVEIPADDAEKLSAFYSSVFGWQFGSAPGMETYKMAQTGPGDVPLGVAIYPRENDGARLTNYVGVESVKAYVEKIKVHGGTVLHEFSVGGMGHGAITLDPEGNMLGIWEHDPSATSTDGAA